MVAPCLARVEVAVVAVQPREPLLQQRVPPLVDVAPARPPWPRRHLLPARCRSVRLPLATVVAVDAPAREAVLAVRDKADPV